MDVDFLYGSNGLKISVPDEIQTTILNAGENPGLQEPVQEIFNKICHPMNSQPLPQLLEKNLKKKNGIILILIDDHTRPISSGYFLDALTQVFQDLNIEDEQVKILVSTGLHRKSTLQELERMIGEEYINRYDIIFHDANDEMELELVGTTSSGNAIYLNTQYVHAAFRIVTGYVEPHFFSGYSGGRKAIVPGIAGKSTILFNHSAKNIHCASARFGHLNNNFLHEDMVEATRLLKPEFCINATLNRNHEMTHVAAGNIFAVFNHLVQLQNQECFMKISHSYDMVICGNGGYPLDLNLYQAVKSMALGELACKKGGVIITVNECRDGVGQESFEKLINSGNPPHLIYENALNGKIRVPDIWEIQVMARVLMHHSVYVVSSMKVSNLGNVGLKYAATVDDAIKMGVKELKMPLNKVRLLILPDGPLVLPVVQE